MDAFPILRAGLLPPSRSKPLPPPYNAPPPVAIWVKFKVHKPKKISSGAVTGFDNDILDAENPHMLVGEEGQSAPPPWVQPPHPAPYPSNVPLVAQEQREWCSVFSPDMPLASGGEIHSQ